MVDRICISINNRCNLNCKYCHFHEKEQTENVTMDVFEILANVKAYADHTFKIGFVGSGEPLLNIDKLREYLTFIEDDPYIQTYTITNGTIALEDEDWIFLEKHNVNVGFSLDGCRELHNLYRCNTFDRVTANVERYRSVVGHYPTFNATVGPETIRNADEVIEFFAQFGTRITFSRMIGRYGISLDEYRDFMDMAETKLYVRRGGLDCTMYGGMCGAGTNNYFFSNGKIFLCGNCIDLSPVGDSGMSFYDLERLSLSFDRNKCYKESLCGLDCMGCQQPENHIF